MKNLNLNVNVLQSVVSRALYLAAQMIQMANSRADREKGDPKVGGHSSASASAIHILGALHLVVKSGFDFIANKPHASPADHSYNYLLDLLVRSDLSRLTLEEANNAMGMLRAFPQGDGYVFQSYHSAYDPDHHNFLPSGTVGIPPVNAGYLAHAYRFAKDHGYDVPPAHFWSIIGDSEFREGSLFEAIPDFAERELGNLTWIVDYNRQSLDGHRITNKDIMNGNDDVRIKRTMEANGWDVIQVQHGTKRQELFRREGGDTFRNFLENELSDYEFQALLLSDKKALRDFLNEQHKQIAGFIKKLSDDEIYDGIRDLGGTDIAMLAQALLQSKENPRRPCMIIAHTIKGWGLKMAAASGNHSALPEDDEILEMRRRQGLADDMLFARFAETSSEGRFLKQRGEQLYSEMKTQHEMRDRNYQKFIKRAQDLGEMGPSLDINLKMASYPHTQWMLGQLTSKLTRIANTPLEENKLRDKQKPLTADEKTWKVPAELIVSMAPDVGTSTNLNPSMDGKIFGAVNTEDFETELQVRDSKQPDLVPGHEESDRFLRFDIAEGNVMSCMGSFGKMRDILGIPFLPLMTVYDFFVKRAHDQFFYDLYWKSSFILVGTPSGVTLSPEGAQHGWKSDFQIPNQITWEPFFCVELDWILCDAIRRHLHNDNEGRTGVFIRGVTRGIEQKDLLRCMKTQRKYKQGLSDEHLLHPAQFAIEGAVDESQVEALSDEQILADMREFVLAGAYYLLDYRGYANYEPGDNVVHIFSLGSPTTEAIKASEALLAKGIYANVIVVTCTDLLVGNIAHADDFNFLKSVLGITGDLHLTAAGVETTGDLMTLSGRRIPIVSVHDGEPGLLDNLGAIVGVKHEALAVRKHSRCGRPTDVYQYHHIDAESVVATCEKVLTDSTNEKVQISSALLRSLQ